MLLKIIYQLWKLLTFFFFFFLLTAACKELVSVNVTLTRAQIKDFGHKFKSKKDKSTWRRVDYTVVMTLNNSHFEITVNCRGQDITSFNTEYVEE